MNDVLAREGSEKSGRESENSAPARRMELLNCSPLSLNIAVNFSLRITKTGQSLTEKMRFLCTAQEDVSNDKRRKPDSNAGTRTRFFGVQIGKM